MKNKGNLLAGLLAGLVFVTMAFAAATKYTDLTTTGNTVLGDAVTDTVTLTGVTAAPRHATPRTSVTPPLAGSFIWNSTAGQLCVSSGTTRFTWVQVSSPTAACAN